jgi:hypothetical protein
MDLYSTALQPFRGRSAGFGPNQQSPCRGRLFPGGPSSSAGAGSSRPIRSAALGLSVRISLDRSTDTLELLSYPLERLSRRVLLGATTAHQHNPETDEQ